MMNNRIHASDTARQRGITLVVGLVMLVVTTLIVITGYRMSQTNLLAVGNSQFRDEALAAANLAIEQVLSSPFTASPTAESIDVDINYDDTADYTVAISAPACNRRTEISSSAAGYGSSVTLGLPSGVTNYNTAWEIDAQVTDLTTGASVQVKSGIRVILSETQMNSVCSS